MLVPKESLFILQNSPQHPMSHEVPTTPSLVQPYALEDARVLMKACQSQQVGRSLVSFCLSPPPFFKSVFVHLIRWLLFQILECQLSVDGSEGAAVLQMKAGPRSRSSRNGLGRGSPGTRGASQVRRRPPFRPCPVSQDEGLSARGLLKLCGVCLTTGDVRGVHWRGQQGTGYLRPTFTSF